MPRILPFFLLLLSSLALGATPSGTTTPFLSLTNLWTLHLTLSAPDWAGLEPKRPAHDGGFPSGPDRPPRDGAPGRADLPAGPGGFGDTDYPWRTATFECAGQTLTNVGVRFKGNSSFNMSRASLKRPFKLDFDRDSKGRTFRGHEELLLNNNVNDGTQFREALAYDAFRRAGVPAPRTAFAKVFLTINGERTNEFLGLYTLVEAVEGDFLQIHFGTRKGLLVKPDRVRGLEYLGEDWNAYTKRYNPKTHVKPGDTRRFIGLTKFLAEDDDATFVRELPNQLDVDGFLRFIALNALLANYDSFLGTGHNYYFFQPRAGGKAAFIPWDLNEAFGGHPGAGPRNAQAEFSVLRPQASPSRLLERMLGNPEWAAAYRRELTTLLADTFNPDRLHATAELLAQVTQDAAFTESPFAKAAFQRSALGQTNVSLPERRPDRRPREGDAAGRPGQPPFGGPGRSGADDLPFAEWVALRCRNVKAELAGERSALPPRMRGQNGPPPGGRGGPTPRPRQPAGPE